MDRICSYPQHTSDQIVPYCQELPNPSLTASVPVVSTCPHPQICDRPAIPPVDLTQRKPNPGVYGFSLTLDDTQEVASVSKGLPYMWSGREVCVNARERIPITICLEHPLPSGCILRGFVVFRNGDSNTVRKCAKCVDKDGGAIYRDHIVVAHEGSMPYYGIFDNTPFVDVPVERLMSDGKRQMAVYTFHCFSSHEHFLGQRRKRPSQKIPLRLVVQVICNDMVISVGTIDVRICACPKRDKDKKEQDPSPKRLRSIGKGKSSQNAKCAVKLDYSIPPAEVSSVTSGGRRFYKVTLFVPEEKADMKQSLLSMDLAQRTFKK